MKKKATDVILGNLHAILADVLAEQVAEYATEEDNDGRVTKVYTATPALLTVAARFLKDNDITCGVEDSGALNNLADELAKRKRRSRLDNITHIDEAVHG